MRRMRRMIGLDMCTELLTFGAIGFSGAVTLLEVVGWGGGRKCK